MRLKAKWDDCCAQKKIGGLNFTNLNETLLGLLCKWNLYVFELGDFSFKLLIWYKLNKYMFLRHKCWVLNPLMGTGGRKCCSELNLGQDHEKWNFFLHKI